MKKISFPTRAIAAGLMAAITAFAFASCTQKLAHDAYDCDLNDYIDAGDISKIEISASEVEKAVDTRIYSIAWQNSLFTDITESGKAEKYDKLIVDYTCAVDGLVIDSFGGKDASVFIGSGTMIPGMEEGLIGMAVTDQPRVLTLTFPDEYYSDLGGKEAIFTVTLKNIFRPEEITDGTVRKYTNHESLQAMREALTRTVAAEMAFNQLYERATVKKYPEEEYNRFYSDVTYLETYAKEQKMTVVEFLAKYGDQFTEFGFEKGMTEEEYRTACKEYAERTTKEDMLMYHLLRELKVKTSGSAYREMKKTLLRDYNMADAANYDDVYGEGAFENSMRYNLMLNALYTHVVLK